MNKNNNNLVLIPLVLMFLSQALIIEARGAGGGGGHGHATGHGRPGEGRDGHDTSGHRDPGGRAGGEGAGGEGHKEAPTVELDVTLPALAEPADIKSSCETAGNATMCNESLNGDPKIKGLGPYKLTLYALNAAKTKGAGIAGSILEAQYLKDPLSKHMRRALGRCGDDYAAANTGIDNAINLITTSNPNVSFVDKVRSSLEVAKAKAMDCNQNVINTQDYDLIFDNGENGNIKFFNLVDIAESSAINLQKRIDQVNLYLSIL